MRCELRDQLLSSLRERRGDRRLGYASEMVGVEKKDGERQHAHGLDVSKIERRDLFTFELRTRTDRVQFARSKPYLLPIL